MNQNNNIKWRTELEIVNIETAEILLKSQVERKEYLVIRKTKRVEIQEYLDKKWHGTYRKIGRIIWTWECIESPQTTLNI